MPKLLLITALALLTSLLGCSRSEKLSQGYTTNDEVVVVAHGLGRSDFAMRWFVEQLEAEYYRVCALDYATIGQSVAAVVSETTQQIDNCTMAASKVHFIGHSLGGLVIRAYLQDHQQLNNNAMLGEVVLMGTPNKGSELADHYQNTWLMWLGGEVSQVLVTGEQSLGNQLAQPVFQAGIIAGVKSTRLTNNIFSQANDGLVSVDSAKLANMRDYIEVAVGHSDMRTDERVAKQAIYFLQHGMFNKSMSTH